MTGDQLSYRCSGVDVEANKEANRRIERCVRRTFTSSVLTRPGLFGGAVSLKETIRSLVRPVLCGALGFSAEEAAAARQVARNCRSRLNRQAFPIAFLDYIAAAALEPARAADLVEDFSEEFLREPKVPIIGGETAEMPAVFRSGAWEVVGALFAMREAGDEPKKDAEVALNEIAGFSHPALVFSMDGVGTKTKLAVSLGRSSGLALDIINHSLNDILCQGARGVAVMLYVGCHRREERLLQPLLAAAEKACAENSLALLDLVVVEKPQLYLPGEIDFCAAIAGSVDADRLIQGTSISAGDVLIGLHSSGLHTNGYSLARSAVLDRGGLDLNRTFPELGCTLGEALLEPHRNYAPAVLPILQDRERSQVIEGIAHITGGGIQENLVRILPAGLAAEIKLESWQPPPIFELIERTGNIALHDPVGKGMYEVFNMGIGMILIVPAVEAAAIVEAIGSTGYRAAVIGEIVAAGRPGEIPVKPGERVRLLQ